MLTRKGVFGVVGGHSNRPLAIDPKTGALFVGVGSGGNIDIEPAVKATVQRFGPTEAARPPSCPACAIRAGSRSIPIPERSGQSSRSATGSATAWFRTTSSGRRRAPYYGWPYAYMGQRPQPGFASRAPREGQAVEGAGLALRVALLRNGHCILRGQPIPHSEYRGSAFVVFRGSWNRSEPTGCKVVRVPFKDGQPEGSYENFMTGTSSTQRSVEELPGC